MYASFDHWTLHLPVETQTSWTIALKLQNRLQVFKSKFVTMFAEHRRRSQSNLADQLWIKFNLDLELVENEMNATVTLLHHLEVPSPRRAKRSLLPFVGSALSSIFGTATNDQIRDILTRVKELGDSQTDVLSVLDDTVTVINQTLVDVDVNRQMINRLTNLTNDLTKRVNTFRNVMLTDIVITDLQSKLDLVFSDLIASVQDLRKGVFNLEMIFSLAENGILPRSLLPPRRFAEILAEIQKDLPPHVGLPFPPQSTDKYYATVHVQTVRTSNGVSVLVNIPLISVRDQFNVFQIFNVPVPKIGKDHTFVASYRVGKTRFVALSEDSLKFVFLDDDDINVYLRRQLPFCPLRRPIMTVSASTECIPALLTNQTDKISRYCDKEIRVHHSVDPTAEYLGNGHWLVTSVKPLNMRVRCKNQTYTNLTKSVQTVTTLSLIKLDFGCSVSNRYFRLPVHFRTDSYLEPYQITHLNLSLTQNDVWRRVTASLSESNVSLSQAVATLPPLQNNAVTLTALKQHIHALKTRARYHFFTVTVPAVSTTSVIVLAIFVFVICKFVRCQGMTSFRSRSGPSSPQIHPPDGSTDNATDGSGQRTSDIQATPEHAHRDSCISRLLRRDPPTDAT